MTPAPAPVEQSLVQYLSSLGRVATRVPNPRPASFIRVTRTGGVVLSVGLSDVSVLVECFGNDETLAWTLVQGAWQLMFAATTPDALPLGVEVMDVSLTEPVNFPDTTANLARYQFIATLVVNL